MVEISVHGKKKTLGWRITFLLIFSLITAFLILIDIFPLIHPVPYRDSGVFLYTAQQMLRGGTPYLDSWDHKGPFLYFLNFIALWISSDTVWGIYLLQMLLLTAVLFFLIFAVRHFISFGVSLPGIALFSFMLPRVADGGNLTEFYSAIFLIASIAVFLFIDRTKRQWLWGVIGFFGGAVLLIRPNNVVFWLVSGILLLADAIRQPATRCRLYFFLGGFGLAVGAALIYLAVHHALDAAYDQYIRFNFFYLNAESGTSGKRALILLRIKRLKYVFLTMQSSWGKVAILCGIAAEIFAAVILAVKPWRQQFPERIKRIMLMLVAAFPLEILVISLSDRVYRHYLQMIPVYFLAFVIFFCAALITFFRLRKESVCWLVVLPGFIGLAAVLLPSFQTAKDIADALVTGELNFGKQPTLEEKIILENTLPSDTIQIWQGETRYNFLAQRQSPTRFSYVFPLWSCAYANFSDWHYFLSTFTANPPRLFIVTREHAEQYGIIEEGCATVTPLMSDFINSSRISIN